MQHNCYLACKQISASFHLINKAKYGENAFSSISISAIVVASGKKASKRERERKKESWTFEYCFSRYEIFEISHL